MNAKDRLKNLGLTYRSDEDEFNVFISNEERMRQRDEKEKEWSRETQKRRDIKEKEEMKRINKLLMLTDQDLKNMRTRWKQQEKSGISFDMSEVD